MQNIIAKAQRNLHQNIPEDFKLNVATKTGDDWPMDGITLRQAAVLIGITDKPSPSVILTRRPMHMKKHAGQISLPGGKLEPSDKDATSAALREAQEEIGLHPQFVNVLGCLDVYQIGSGYKICPIVATLDSGYALTADPNEVDEIFEVPLDFLMREDNYKMNSKNWLGKDRRFYVLEYKDYVIWGATAGMLKNLANRFKD
ncbi:MAG: CoA pyrophosphatase [Hyphomicrobiales bacterium]